VPATVKKGGKLIITPKKDIYRVKRGGCKWGLVLADVLHCTQQLGYVGVKLMGYINC